MVRQFSKIEMDMIGKSHCFSDSLSKYNFKIETHAVSIFIGNRHRINHAGIFSVNKFSKIINVTFFIPLSLNFLHFTP